MRWSATGHGQNVVQALMIMLAFMIMLGSSFKLVLQRYRECMYCLCCTLIDGYCGAESTIWCCMRIAIAGVKELCSGEIPSVCCQTCCTQLQQPHVLNTGVLLCHSVAAAALAWCIHSDWRVSTFQNCNQSAAYAKACAHYNVAFDVLAVPRSLQAQNLSSLSIVVHACVHVFIWYASIVFQGTIGDASTSVTSGFGHYPMPFRQRCSERCY